MFLINLCISPMYSNKFITNLILSKWKELKTHYSVVESLNSYFYVSVLFFYPFNSFLLTLNLTFNHLTSSPINNKDIKQRIYFYHPNAFKKKDFILLCVPLYFHCFIENVFNRILILRISTNQNLKLVAMVQIINIKTITINNKTINKGLG